jgi:hypothetical protein
MIKNLRRNDAVTMFTAQEKSVFVLLCSLFSWRIPPLLNTWAGIFLVHYEVSKTLCHAGSFHTSNDIFIIAIIFFHVLQCNVFLSRFLTVLSAGWELFSSDICSQTNKVN